MWVEVFVENFWRLFAEITTIIIFVFFRYIISQSWIAIYHVIYEYIIHLKLRRFRRASRNRDRRIITCKSIISITIILAILVKITSLSNDNHRFTITIFFVIIIIIIVIILFIIIVIINILMIKGHSPLHKSTASAESGSCWTSCGWYSPGDDNHDDDYDYFDMIVSGDFTE